MMADTVLAQLNEPNADMIAKLCRTIDEIINDRVRDIRYEFMGYEGPSTTRRAPIAMLSRAFCERVGIACVDDYLLLAVGSNGEAIAEGISGQAPLLKRIQSLHPFQFVPLLVDDDRARLDWEVTP